MLLLRLEPLLYRVCNVLVTLNHKCTPMTGRAASSDSHTACQQRIKLVVILLHVGGNSLLRKITLLHKIPQIASVLQARKTRFWAFYAIK